MFKLISKILVCTLFLMQLVKTNCQDLSINHIEQVNGEININYDLTDSDSVVNRYTVRLYSSLDRYQESFEKVDGDIGLIVSEGTARQMKWRMASELGEDFEGDVRLELRANPYIPFVILDSLSNETSFKRGKEHTISWERIRRSNKVYLELFRGSSKIMAFDEAPNIGYINLFFPKNLNLGKGYYFKISSNEDKDHVVYSDKFSIERKIPNKLKAIVGGAFIGIITIIISGGNSDAAETIPDPPVPSNDN